MAEKIFIGADHAGFELKQKLVAELKKLGYEPVDVGPKDLDPADDFPDFAKPVAKAVSSEDFWPLFLLIAAGIFLIDVFIRRVTVHFYWVLPALAYAYNRVRGRQLEVVRDERLERLRNRKAAISSQIDERRAAARFEPQAPEGFSEPRDYEQVLSDASGGPAAAPPRPEPASQESLPQTEQDTYTERLLAAKKKAKGK